MAIFYQRLVSTPGVKTLMDSKIKKIYEPAFNRQYCDMHKSYDTLIVLRYVDEFDIKANVKACCEEFKIHLTKCLVNYIEVVKKGLHPDALIWICD